MKSGGYFRISRTVQGRSQARRSDLMPTSRASRGLVVRATALLSLVATFTGAVVMTSILAHRVSGRRGDFRAAIVAASPL